MAADVREDAVSVGMAARRRKQSKKSDMHHSSTPHMSTWRSHVYLPAAMDGSKAFLGLLNGVFRMNMAADNGITSLFLKQELYPDAPQAGVFALLAAVVDGSQISTKTTTRRGACCCQRVQMTS